MEDPTIVEAGAVGRTFHMDPLIHLASSDVDRLIRSAAAVAILRMEKDAQEEPGG